MVFVFEIFVACLPHSSSGLNLGSGLALSSLHLLPVLARVSHEFLAYFHILKTFMHELNLLNMTCDWLATNVFNGYQHLTQAHCSSSSSSVT